MALGIFLGLKKRPARRADKFAAICEPKKHQPLGTLRASAACTRITLPYIRNENVEEQLRKIRVFVYSESFPFLEATVLNLLSSRLLSKNVKIRI
jgi:hypothetical protein